MRGELSKLGTCICASHGCQGAEVAGRAVLYVWDYTCAHAWQQKPGTLLAHMCSQQATHGH